MTTAEFANSITDFVSGVVVKATPEEVHAVQVFSQLLVNDYGYPKEHIRTRPQWRVKVRPSDVKKEYPIDIAVFDCAAHDDKNVQIIVECKKPNRRDGRTQLQDYLRFSEARLGVWFNGQEKLFLLKSEKSGKVNFEEIPNIPRYGERLEDIGRYRRRDLQPTHNLKSVFKTIRNYLAANAVGITRDEVFAQQIINLIFCKIYDERFTKADDMVRFRAGFDENPADVRARIEAIFSQVKKQYSDVIESSEKILLDDISLAYAVGELHLFCLTETERDAIAEAFEVFIGPSLKGGQGQFFTPRNVVKLLVDMVGLTADDKVIDPACGSGGFLVESLREIWRKIEIQGAELSWPENEIFAEKQEKAIKNIRGIDKDYFLAKVAKAYMAIIGDGRGGVFCENSLENRENWKALTQEDVHFEGFDVVLTNPPFGKKLKIDDKSILRKYQLGHKWKKEKGAAAFGQTDDLHDGQSPQILFIERCIALMKDGARMGIMVPESMFCNPSHRYIIEYIKSVARIVAVVSFPENLFQPFTHAKACGVIIEKTPTEPANSHSIFMAVAKWCGHDSRGLPIPHDDIPRIMEKYDQYKLNSTIEYDHFGFAMNESEIVNDVYLPKYYNPEIQSKIKLLQSTHDIVNLGNLMDEGVIKITTGHEVGKLAYGTGHIPFIRTSDIANWEIKLDPKHGVSQDIFEGLKKKQDVRSGDILMVRDGTYLVGTCAIVSDADTEILFQSHIYKIRSKDHKRMHPNLLLAVLSSPIVREQIFAKRFTQDIIDTLGGRIKELQLPIPKDAQKQRDVIDSVSKSLDYKSKARALARSASLDVAPIVGTPDPEFMTLIG